MWQRFTSSFTNKVDAKGRVSLPAPFRKVLDARGADGFVVLLPGIHQQDCLEGYAPDAFNRMAANIERMHPSDKRRLRLERRILGQSQPVQIDENGRLALPGHMRSRYGLSGETVFVGLGERFEMWAKADYDALMAGEEDEDDAAELLDALSHMPHDDVPGGLS